MSKYIDTEIESTSISNNTFGRIYNASTVFQKLRKLRFVTARTEFPNKHAKKQEDSRTASVIF